jgi:hypothetical protein
VWAVLVTIRTVIGEEWKDCVLVQRGVVAASTRVAREDKCGWSIGDSKRSSC